MAHTPRVEADEEAMAARMLRGDPEAFALLYERYFPRVYDLAFRMLGDPDLALDVAQDTFLRLLEGRPRQPPRHFRAYLYTIARHQIADVLRRSRRQIPLPDIGEARPVEPEPDETPEREVIGRERTAILREAMRALPEEEAMLLDLHLRHGLAPAELAEIFRCSVGALHTRLSRARDHLEEALAAWILLRIGWRACPALAAQIGSPGAPPPALTLELRRTLRQHLDGCAVCQETRRRHLSAAEWLGAVGILGPGPERAREVRARLSQRAQALAAGGAAIAVGGTFGLGPLKGVGIALLGGFVALGLGMLAVGGFIAASGSAAVQVENRNCPPLTPPPLVTRLAGVLPNLEMPPIIPPGVVRTARVPPALVTLMRSGEGIRVEAYGLAFTLSVEGLERAEWDGVDLPPGPYAVRLHPGSRHALRLHCR